MHAPALPRRPARAGRALARRARAATSSGARRPAAGASRRATSSSRRGCAARPRCCTTRASTRTSGWRSSSASASAVLCMAPTEYRVIAKRAAPRPVAGLRGLVAAGEALEPRGPARLARGDRPVDPRRLRPDRDRPARPACRSASRRGPGSMGRPLPGVRLWIDDGELVADPATVPTFFLRLPRRAPAPRDRPLAHRRPRPRRRRRLPVLRGPRRRRDHLGRLPDRPVRGRVRAGRARRRRRGGGGRRARRGARQRRARGRRAARRLRAVGARSPRELQDHVKAQTAPYKYPRIVDFAEELPKTPSGKVRRAAAASDIGRDIVISMSEPSSSSPLFVRLPSGAAERLGPRRRSRSGASKKDVVTALVQRHVDPDTPGGLGLAAPRSWSRAGEPELSRSAVTPSAPPSRRRSSTPRRSPSCCRSARPTSSRWPRRATCPSPPHRRRRGASRAPPSLTWLGGRLAPSARAAISSNTPT